MTACNMFAYCGNNPVNYVDYSGEYLGLIKTLNPYNMLLYGGGGGGFYGVSGGYSASGGYAFSGGSSSSIGSWIGAAFAVMFGLSQSKGKSEVAITQKPAKDPTHHIVAQNDHRAEEARQILIEVGIDYKTDSRNLVVLPKSYHVHLHNDAYYMYVNQRLRMVAGDKAGVEATLASLRIEIIVRCALGIRWD